MIMFFWGKNAITITTIFSFIIINQQMIQICLKNKTVFGNKPIKLRMIWFFYLNSDF